MEDIIGDLGELLSEVIERFNLLDKYREEVIRLSRLLLNYSVEAINKALRGDLGGAEEKLSSAGEQLSTIKTIIGMVPPEERHHLLKIIHDGLREYVEALCLLRYLGKGGGVELKGLLSLGASPIIEGVFDFIGELRRIFLEYLINGEVAKARKILEDLKSLYAEMTRLNVKNYYLPTLKRRLDIFRGQLDKCLEDYHLSMLRGGRG
jgi:translin